MINLKYYFTTISDGPMNTNAAFYNEGMSKEQIRNSFDNRRIDVGIREGFNGLHTVIPIMKNSTKNDLYEDGKSVRITNDMLYGYSDYYDLDIYADILTMDDTVYKTALCYPVADCPVVFVRDNYKNAVGMAHCGGEYIDRNVPAQIVEAMQETYNSEIRDLSVYIGPFIHEENYVWDKYPTWAKNTANWDGFIKEEKDGYHISLDKAIIKQMQDKGIDLGSICTSIYDTYTSSTLYSNSASKNNPVKAGRFFQGCFFTGEDKVLRK